MILRRLFTRQFALVGLAIGLFSSSTFALEISVTDYHLKLLVNQILIDNAESKTNEKVTLNLPFQFERDPHHYEPSMQSIKQFLTAPFQILNLNGDNWRSDLSKKLTGKNHLILNGAHFWLDPELGCQNFQKIQAFLLAKSLLKPGKQAQCPYKLNPQVKNILNSPSLFKVILTHNGLQGFFNQVSPEKLFVLGHQDHGNKITPDQLKQIYQMSALPQEQPILWIIETQLDIPARLERRIRPFDHVIKINTLGSKLNSSEQILEQLQTEILKIHQKDSRV